MSYVTGPKRIIRNPITGEELHYTKGTKNPNEQGPQIPFVPHETRVDELVAKRTSHFVTSFENQNKPPPPLTQSPRLQSRQPLQNPDTTSSDATFNTTAQTNTTTTI